MGSRAPLIARAAALGYAGLAAYATRVAIEDDVPARFGGREYPGSVQQQFLWAGTGLSPPSYLVVAYAQLARTGHRTALAVLSLCTIAGHLGEPVTYRAVGRQRAIVIGGLGLLSVIAATTVPRPRAESPR